MIELDKKTLLNEIKSGKSRGWKEVFDYDIIGNTIVIEMNTVKKSLFRQIDAWGLAVLAYAQEQLDMNYDLKMVIKNKEDKFLYHLEALRRRVSYLNINNDFNIKLIYGDESINLYKEDSLYQRPENEVIRTAYNEDHAKDKPGKKIEKDFQVFLFGNYKEKDKTNERLAVLGYDFYNLHKKNYGIIREFPTGVFNNEVTQKNRVLPTEFIDIVTINKSRGIAVIELKLNDPSLSVISQLLDYSLFFRCYLNQLLPTLKERIYNSLKEDITCYVVNNHFHPKFDSIVKYYTNQSLKYHFKIKKVTLGHYVEY